MDDTTPAPPVKWEPLRFFEVGGRKYELSEIEITQQIDIHELRERLWKNEVKAANKTDRLNKELKTLRDVSEDYLNEIRAIHYAYLKIDCDTCDGVGTVREYHTCNYPSSWDPMIPAELMETVECEDCLGTGKEWVST